MHLKESFVKWGQIVGHDTVIGLLGKTGNGRQPEKFNWQKMFYLNPYEYLRSK